MQGLKNFRIPTPSSFVLERDYAELLFRIETLSALGSIFRAKFNDLFSPIRNETILRVRLRRARVNIGYVIYLADPELTLRGWNTVVGSVTKRKFRPRRLWPRFLSLFVFLSFTKHFGSVNIYREKFV